MTANRVDSFETWIRSVEKRIIRLERKPRSGGDATGVPASTSIGWAGEVPFTDGLSTVPIARVASALSAFPQAVGGIGALAGFDATTGEMTPINTAVDADFVWLLAPVSDGDYLVTVLFFELRG